MIETLHIYHTNDLHSHFEEWPKIVKYIEQKRELHDKEKEDMFLFDIGDHVDRFHPISEASLGQLNVEMLNRLKYDSVTIGNNEGITLPFEALDRLYEHAKFDVLAANLYTKDHVLPTWVKPYKIYTTSSGTKIGVLGITVFYKLFYELLGWEIKDPFEITKELILELKEKTDVTIVLSHLGINDDEMLAAIPGIDIILGGHTHHLFPNGKMIGNTLLCGAGKYGQYIGYVEIKLDLETKKLIDKKATVVQTSELRDESFETKDLLIKYAEQSDELLSNQIGYLEEDLLIDWFEESPFARLLANALKAWCDSDLAMVNSGIILDSLPKGPISKKDIHRICPHPINPCKVWLKGDELKEIILQAHTEKMEKLEVIGLGFRGKFMGKMIYEGVQFESVVLSDGLRHVKNILINHEPIDHNRVYTIGTVDMFTFGYLFPIIRDAKNKEYFMPEMVRDVLTHTLTAVKQDR